VQADSRWGHQFYFGFRSPEGGTLRLATPRFGVQASADCAAALPGALDLLNAISALDQR